MPTITRTTSGMIDPSAGSIQSSVDSIRALFVAGAVIEASHYNAIFNIWRSFNTHYHQTADYAFEAYGNTASTGTFYDTNPENTGRLGITNYADEEFVTAGETILAYDHGILRLRMNQLNDHTHTIDDRVY